MSNGQKEETRVRRNWAGNYAYHAAALFDPSSITELQQLLPTFTRAKALGARHSFNSIADTLGTQISLSRLKSIALDTADAANPTVTIGAGITYGELAPVLHRRGFAVPNLASLPHIVVAGACATATHGSGLSNQCLSAAISAIDLVTADGELLHLSRTANHDIFPGAIVALGALGVVTNLTLDLVPSFQIAQTVYENLPFHELEQNLSAVFSAGYSVSLFTDWQHHRATQAWIKRIASDATLPETFFDATRQTVKLHPLPNHSAENCTEQLDLPGAWHERLPHFRLDFTPSSGAELQTEYFVPLSEGFNAIRAIEELRDRITPHLFISELRTVAADDLWLSMAYARNSLAIHFTWKPAPEAVLSLLPLIEAQLAPFAARPHWGKLFTTSPTTLRHLYPRFNAFRGLAAQLDPNGVFRNDYLAALLD